MTAADRSDTERALWRFAMQAGLRGEFDSADRAVHLARGVRAGVEVDEVLERIAAGELEEGPTGVAAFYSARMR